MMRLPRALAVCVLAACGGPRLTARVPPSVDAPPAQAASVDAAEGAWSRYRIDAGMQQEGFPAISGDGMAVAVLDMTYDCCSGALRVAGQLRTLRDELATEWLLADQDDAGTNHLPEAVAAARAEELNATLARRRFVGMSALIPLEARNLELPVTVADGDGGTLTLEVVQGSFRVGDQERSATIPRPLLDLSSDCCDGGDGRGERCTVPAETLGLWRSGDVFVLATGREAQMDGCSRSPTYHVVVAERVSGGQSAAPVR